MILDCLGGKGAHQNLVEEVLNELLLQWSRGEEPVEIGAQQLGDCIGLINIVLALISDP